MDVYICVTLEKDNVARSRSSATPFVPIFATVCGFETAAFAVNYTGLIKQH